MTDIVQQCGCHQGIRGLAADREIRSLQCMLSLRNCFAQVSCRTARLEQLENVVNTIHRSPYDFPLAKEERQRRDSCVSNVHQWPPMNADERR